MCLPLPIRSTMAQRSSRRCKLSKVSSESSCRRSPQPSRMARIARLRFPVRVWASGNCQSADASPAVSQLPRREPSLRTPLTRVDPGSQFGAQQAGVGHVVSQPSHSSHSHVDRPGCEAAFLYVKPIAQNHCFIQRESWFRTVPGYELIDSMLISAPRVRRTEAPEDRGLRVFQVGYAELSLWSVLLALCFIRGPLTYDCRPPLRRLMRLMGH